MFRKNKDQITDWLRQPLRGVGNLILSFLNAMKMLRRGGACSPFDPLHQILFSCDPPRVFLILMQNEKSTATHNQFPKYQNDFYKIFGLLIFYSLYSLYARFARQRAGMMRPIARSDISANEVSHSPFLQKRPYRNEFCRILKL